MRPNAIRVDDKWTRPLSKGLADLFWNRSRESKVVLNVTGRQVFCPTPRAYKRLRRAKAILSRRKVSFLLRARVKVLESLRRLV